MQNRDTPPHSGPNTPETQVLRYSPATTTDSLATPTSLPSVSLTSTPKTSRYQASKNPTQDEVEAGLLLKRHQQDLLVLTSLNDNSTLHWRPSWFEQVPFNDSFWTLHNPPNVVTEKLPSSVPQSKDYYTRRMRQQGDRPPIYIKTWDHWDRYCELYGVPPDFLSEYQVGLMRLGLPRTEKGALCALPSYPLYPEPQPRGCGHYILDPSTYTTHLPSKFRSINHDAEFPEDVQVVVVHSDVALIVERKDEMHKHHIKWTLSDGKTENGDDSGYDVVSDSLKQQGPARRWTYVPWTSEQDESCKRLSLVVKLKVNHKRNHETTREDEITGIAHKTEDKKPNKKNNVSRMLRELQ
ncbi:unnamed protein product [Alternaria alternata]